MNISIKDFKTKIQCDSILKAKTILSNDFKGDHVSILIELDNGLNKLLFLSIDSNGFISDTYTKKEINMDEII